MLLISFSKLESLGKVIRDLNPNPFYPVGGGFPSDDADPKDIGNYLLFMVAIDHRTGTPSQDFRARINGREMRGSDLLYYLGIQKFNEDPDNFSPQMILDLPESEIASWFRVGGTEPLGLRERVWLMKDVARKLILLYGGDVLRLLQESENKIYAPPSGGFVERLKVFRAYEDPVEKKPFLLLKFLHRRRLFSPKDYDNAQVPVDNHLVRIAVRLGIVVPRKEILDLFLWHREANYEQDVIIRMTVRMAYKELSRVSGVDPLTLDDFLWQFGRKVCWYSPRCHLCPLREMCDAFLSGRQDALREHLFYRTWYY